MHYSTFSIFACFHENTDFTNMFLEIMSLQVFSKLNIYVGASYFKNICNICHLPSLTNQDVGFYYYTCKATVPHKPKHELHAKLRRKAARSLNVSYLTLGSNHFLIMILEPMKILQSWEGFFLQLFCDKKT